MSDRRRTWTEQEEAILVTRRAHGHSFGKIAKELGRTKNSVIGKADRMCLTMGRAGEVVWGEDQP